MIKQSRKIPGFPRYEVTTDGEVFNQDGLKLKQEKTNTGYLRVSLSNDSVSHKRISVHRLVADAFIPNPDNLQQIDHINEDKTDNRVENLRWSTPIDNLRHSGVIEKASVAKFTRVRCTTTGETYDSIKDAAIKYNLHHSNIVACCNGRRSKCGNMGWEYVERKDCSYDKD
jgi:hypothetical protein